MTAERPVKIPLSDGKFAYAKLRGDWSRPLVIFAHGFSVDMDRPIPYQASKFLHHHGFSFLRFNFYNGDADARKLIDTTLAQQVRDLTDIVAFARSQGAHRIHVMGHSYGGLTILMMPQLNIDSAILVDPSHPDINFFAHSTSVEALGAYRIQSKGKDYLIGHATVEEFHNLETSSYLPRFHTPALIISATDDALKTTNRQYASSLQANTEIKLVEVPGARHSFDTDESLKQLLATTLAWLSDRKAK